MRSTAAAGNRSLARQRAYWDRFHEDPDDASHRRFLAELLAPERVRGLRALDVGCGGGVVSRILADLGAVRVTALDLSAASLATARRRTAGAPVDLVQMALENAPCLGRFDLVIAYAVLYYCADPVAALATTAACVAPGGTLIVGLVEDSPAARLMNLARRPLSHTPMALRPALGALAAAAAWPLVAGRKSSVTGFTGLRRRVTAGLFVPLTRLFRPEEVAAILARSGLDLERVVPATGTLAFSRHFALAARRPEAA